MVLVAVVVFAFMTTAAAFVTVLADASLTVTTAAGDAVTCLLIGTAAKTT